MRRPLFVTFAALALPVAACSFLLDFDDLQKHPPDAGLGGGAATGGADSGGSSGATSGGSGGMPAEVPLDALAPTLAEAVCAHLTACYESLVEIFIRDEDCQTLFAKILNQQTIVPIQDSVAAGTLEYDPVIGAECYAKLRAGTSQDPPSCSDFNAIIEDCKSAFSGLAGEDGACNHRFECDKGLACATGAGCPGSCTPFARQGETCLQNDHCSPLEGLYCRKLPPDPDAGAADAGAVEMPGTCEPYLELGTSCMPGQDECVPGAICIGGSCQRVSAVFTLSEGQECYTNNLLCDPGLFCEFQGVPLLSVGKCVTERGPTEVCRLALPGECADGYYCSAAGLSTEGTCLALPVEDQACASAHEQTFGISAPCAATLACVNGLCKPMRDLGQSCEASNQCYSGACVDAVCVPPACPAE